MEFSTRSMKKLVQRNTGKRVSDNAGDQIGSFLDDWSHKISSDALEKAKDKGRKTVRAEDIKEALSQRKSRVVEEQFSH